ncbi:MAG: hypothetical protein A4E72_01917 [Syntrophus sp. PtaU1.Bin208]|nr:MAG: hypothetical protein A4E72_01917 [Syntrophus sp. PtaU1.Bin208]
MWHIYVPHRPGMGGQIGFVQDLLNADEQSREVVLLVQRQGITKGVATVEYQTQDGRIKGGNGLQGVLPARSQENGTEQTAAITR